MLPLLPALFFFGSSYLDVGTNKFLNNTTPSNFLPYGETYFHHATGRNSNGRILSDLLELKMGFPFLSPFLQPGANFSLGANFASGGSGLFDDTCIGCEKGPVVPLSRQILQFQQLLCNHTYNLQSKLPESLIVVNVGTNDLIQKVRSQELLQHPNETVGRMVGRFAEFIKVLYESGARRFLIVGLAPLGSTPAFRLTTESKLINTSVRRYNAGTRNAVVKFAAEHNDFEFIFFNTYKRFADVIRKPSKYGLTETEKSCYVAPSQNTARFLCEDTRKYLFWDGIHPTERGYEILVNDIWRGDSSHVFPVNLQTFVTSQ